MPTVDDWISHLEMLQQRSGVKKYSIIVKDLIHLLRASPKELPSREAWMSWLGNVESENTEVDLDALLKLLRECPKNVPIRIPLHPTR
jgi:hypothetical protein